MHIGEQTQRQISLGKSAFLPLDFACFEIGLECTNLENKILILVAVACQIKVLSCQTNLVLSKLVENTHQKQPGN